MNIIGRKYNQLTVLRETDPYILPSGQKNKAVICRCVCGNETKCRVLHLVRNRLVSCGCVKYYKGELRKSGHNRHIRKLWRSIKYRCQKNYIDRHIYYDRGIRVCDEWLKNYHSFENWCIQNGYNENLQIDRIDNYFGYNPDNCRFVSASSNARNKRNSLIVEYKGEKIHIRDLIEREKPIIKMTTVLSRHKNGWTIEEALTTPLVKHGFNRNGGSTKRLQQADK